MNTPVREGETIEGSRTMRNRPYPVLKCSEKSTLMGAANLSVDRNAEYVDVVTVRGVSLKRAATNRQGHKTPQRRCYEAVTKVVNKLRDRPELLERFDYRPPPRAEREPRADEVERLRASRGPLPAALESGEAR